MSVSITNNVNYTLKPTSVACRRKQLLLPSSNKTDFNEGETCVMYLPSLANNVADGQSAYLRFTVSFGGANGFVDNSAHSFIERIQTYGAGGQLVSDISNYPVIAAMLLDLQISQSEKIGLSGTLGTEDYYFTPTGVTLAAAPAIDADEVAGMTPNANRKGKAVLNGESLTFCIPILHPFFSLSEKYFPSFSLSDDTRLEFTWALASKALVGTGCTYTIKNPELVIDYIEFDSAVMGMIQQTYSGSELILPSQDYHHYASMIAAGTQGAISQIIPAKQQSARAVFFAFRPAETQAADSYAVSSRVNPFWSSGDQFNLNIGGVKAPQHPIRTRVVGSHAEWMASTQTALHAFTTLEMNGSLNSDYYNKVATAAGKEYTADSYQNGFCLGVNLDSLRGQSQTQNSGINLSAVTSYYEGFIGTSAKSSAPADENINVDAYVLHDVLFVIDSNGQMSVRW